MRGSRMFPVSNQKSYNARANPIVEIRRFIRWREADIFLKFPLSQ